MEPIQIVSIDITKLKIDAIVNAANNRLLGGGGVDGAIHRAAGPDLLKECRGLNGCPTGDAKITGGYNLPAKFVIHTVGSIWKGGGKNEKSLLASCYRKSMQCGVNNGVKADLFNFCMYRTTINKMQVPYEIRYSLAQIVLRSVFWTIWKWGIYNRKLI